MWCDVTRPVVTYKPRAAIRKPASNPAAESQYKAKLQQLIASLVAKSYPARAKRRGQEGTCTVSFVVNRDGTVHSARIVRSAGVSSLDKAALKAIAKLSGKIPFPTSINKQQWTFTLPLVYRLRG